MVVALALALPVEKMVWPVSFENTAKLYCVAAASPEIVVEVTAPNVVCVPSVSFAGGTAPVLYTTLYSGPPPVHARFTLPLVMLDGVRDVGFVGRVVTVKFAP